VGQADANLYAYVSGAALRNVDPLGLDGEDAQSGNSSASSQPTPVPFGPEGPHRGPALCSVAALIVWFRKRTMSW
jgi:hypothetical protein